MVLIKVVEMVTKVVNKDVVDAVPVVAVAVVSVVVDLITNVEMYRNITTVMEHVCMQVGIVRILMKDITGT